MENSGWERKEVKQVTKEEYENALQYAEVQKEANQDNKKFNEERSWTTKSGVLKHFEFQPHLLNLASLELRADKEVVLASVSRYGRALEYASPELQNDKEVVEAAVEQDGTALEFASSKMKANKEVVLRALDNYAPVAIKFVSPELQEDPDIKMTVKHWRPSHL